MGTEQSAADAATRFDQEIRAYVDARKKAETAEKLAKKMKQLADEQRDRLFDLLESAGMKTVNHEELGTVTRTVRVVATVDDREALMDWLSGQGLLNAMTRVEFHKAALNDLVKERIEEGEPPPDGADSLSIRGIRFTPRR